MPQWVTQETNQVAPVIREIEACSIARRRNFSEPVLRLAMSKALPLLDGLAGNNRALVIRQLLQIFGFDEHRHLRWRLEHKLVQALILNHYCDCEVPITQGLHSYLLSDPPRVRRLLHDEFPGGFYIKQALSDSTGEREIVDRTHILLTRIESGEISPNGCDGVLGEQFVVQERVPMIKEYRVHSIEDQIIEDCTFRRYGRGNIPGERDAPNAYVQGILARLPNGMVGGSLFGWDVGLTEDGRFRVIEANPSGFHPVYKPGFHCSGFYHDMEWGANITARLLRFIEKADQLKVVIEPDVDQPADVHRFYSDVVYWQERLKTEP